MPAILDHLQIDHRNMRQLLRILEEEIDAYNVRGSGDFDQMKQILELAPGKVVVRAGTLDSMEGLLPTTEIYTDHAVKWLAPVAVPRVFRSISDVPSPLDHEGPAGSDNVRVLAPDETGYYQPVIRAVAPLVSSSG
jgi:hypothetical protein